ncbi:2,5-diamino-6-(ribosylamino)-4(3H)-pyrimidinone 5'-phosphate reductase [Stygiolobus caldivivus]|uniref:2,5-diamino-6-(ribosylamino)-4(3H)-pyrimidinone 5'-phosphate reductase n=1 Tax=Stygiolobus caldivivus TaxID=2824673 RepID=A0A8D5U7M2_9CREN|nr:2,5-diamino-6-(ribosylamino)-4(3H)-pyrimidinone 5'-phosphate reductase [Stygiolobus caldivivus]BCU70550.1 diaminohydroxyphosphoribosylaminopyrimidine reductase [Stygiolobus caldivivus]
MKNRPYIIIFATITIDGRLASKDKFSQLSCPSDKRRQHILRSEVDAILVGAETVRVDNPKLTVKYAKGKNPIRVIISKSLNLNLDSNLFNVPPPTIIYTSRSNLKEPEKKKVIDAINTRGVEIRYLDELLMCNIMTDIYLNKGVKKIMVEGGGTTIWNLIKESCYDEIRVTISPRIFGNGISFANGEGFMGIDAPKLKLIDAKLCECGEEVHLIYKK